jgi:hypothetical protein
VPPTVYRYRVAFQTRDLGSVLDMLRYEGARVEDWSHEGDQWAVHLTHENRPTIGRWESFGLVPVDPRTGIRLVEPVTSREVR